jgi:lipoprotein NlpD
MNKSSYNWFIVCLLFTLLAGCINYNARVPVMDAWRQPLKSATSYKVQPGDTLFSIAWGYGLDYRQVAAANNISAPAYHIEVGQTLRLAPNVPTPHLSTKTTVEKIQPVVRASVVTPSVTQKVSANKLASTRVTAVTQSTTTAPPQFISVKTTKRAGIMWAWPARGRIINTFTTGSLNKGIDITGKLNAPVLAAASGRVVYAGSGLRGYGELIIIKHNDEFLSAYAHNQKLLVQEGQVVQVGQIIAKMGNTEAKCVMLHFEVRKAGKPVNPLTYLPTH